MKAFLTLLTFVFALGAIAVAGYGYYERTREVEELRQTIGDLEARISMTQQTADLLKKQSEETLDESELSPAVEKEMSQLREKVEAVKTQVNVLDTQVSALRETGKTRNNQIAGLQQKLASGAAPVPADSVVRREDIESLIDEKMQGQKKLGKEPPLAAVVAQLDLDEIERDALEDVLRQKKNDMMTLLQTPRMDGTNMLDEFGDELIKIMTAGEPDEEKARQTFVKFFGRLAAERVPGSEKTYLAEIIRMQEETRRGFKQALSKDQFRSFEALGIQNAMDIKIPNEPIEMYLQQRMQASGATPGQGQ